MEFRLEETELWNEKQLEETNGIIGSRQCTIPMFATALGAYAAKNLKDKALSKNVLRILINSLVTENDHKGFETTVINGYGANEQLKEIPWISTNFAAQFCLNVIMTLDFIREDLPATLADVDELIKDIPQDQYFRIS